MEPNKFEKHIRKQIRDREIRPSADAWKRVSNRLDVPAEPKRKNLFWYAVAASFIGLLVLSVLVFRQGNDEVNSGTQIVDTKKGEENSIRENLQFDKKEKLQDPIDAIENKSTSVAGADRDLETTRGKKGDIRKSSDNLNRRAAIIASKEDKNENLMIEELLLDSEESIDLKLTEVLAQVDLLEQNNKVVSDAEIDSLLRAAQQELLAEKIIKGDNSVDAVALLTEVEDELDGSFRDQIFERLKSGFLKVRTAVADRNN